MESQLLELYNWNKWFVKNRVEADKVDENNLKLLASFLYNDRSSNHGGYGGTDFIMIIFHVEPEYILLHLLQECM